MPQTTTRPQQPWHGRSARASQPPNPRVHTRALSALELLIALALLAALSAAAIPAFVTLLQDRAGDEFAAQLEAAALRARLDAQRTGSPILLLIRTAPDNTPELLAVAINDVDDDEPITEPPIERAAFDAPAPPQDARPPTDLARAQPGQVLLRLPRSVRLTSDDNRAADPRDARDIPADLLGRSQPTPATPRTAAPAFDAEPALATDLPLALLMPDGSCRALSAVLVRTRAGREGRIEITRYPGTIRIAWLDDPANPAPPNPDPDDDADDFPPFPDDPFQPAAFPEGAP